MTTEEERGTYDWRLIGKPAIIVDGRGPNVRRVACPSADKSHRLVEAWSTEPVGVVGELRYVSNFPHWARYEFEPSRPGRQGG